MGIARLLLIGMIGSIGLTPALGRFASAQNKPAAIAPAEKLADGWDEIDQRLIFLMVRLANTETSLEAVEKAIGQATKASFRALPSGRHRIANELESEWQTRATSSEISKFGRCGRSELSPSNTTWVGCGGSARIIQSTNFQHHRARSVGYQ